MFDTTSGDPNGSLLVLEAESLEAVLEIVHNDPYWTGDVVRVVISTFQMCVRLMVFFLFCSRLQWSKEKVEIKVVSLTVVGGQQAKA